MSTTSRPHLDGPAAEALLKLGRYFTKWDETDDGRAVFREGGRAGRRLLPRPLEPRQGRPLHPRRELHRLVLVEGVRQGRHHHLGVPADRLPHHRARPARVRAPRLSPRRRLLLVHLLPHPRPLPVRTRRADRGLPRGEGPPRRPGRRRSPRSPPTPRPAGATSRPAARAAWSGSPGTRRSRSPRRPTCTRSRPTGPTGACRSRRSRPCRWSRTPSAPGSTTSSVAR